MTDKKFRPGWSRMGVHDGVLLAEYSRPLLLISVGGRYSLSFVWYWSETLDGRRRVSPFRHGMGGTTTTKWKRLLWRLHGGIGYPTNWQRRSV